MKGPLILLFPLLQLVFALPQLKFTPEEYKALKLALKHENPVFITGAIPALPLLTIKNIHSNKFFVLDPLRELNSAANTKLFGFKIRKHLKDILAPIYRSDAANIKPISKRRLITQLDNNIRRKRQATSGNGETDSTDDEEEGPTVYAEELGFGLSTAGGVLGGALGGYLDTTGQATVKLIKSLENLGLLALSQIDMVLEQQEERRRKEKEEQEKNSYGPPPI